jgi:hypothetical protein
MQERNQACTAVIHAVALVDPRPDHLRAARQVRPNPFDQRSFLLARQMPCAAALMKNHQPCEAVLFVQPVPTANRVVVHQ